MAKNTQTRKFSVNRKAIAALTLAVALVLTVIFVALGMTGRKMDAEGLYTLLPWLPTTSQTSKWREALVPGAGLGETQVAQLSPVVEGEAGAADLKAAVQVLSRRLRDLGWTDAAVEIKDGKLAVTLPQSADSAYLNTILTAKGEYTFTDPAGTVFMNGSNVTSAGFGYADNTGNNFALSLQFDAQGKEAFAQKSTELTGQNISLLRDGVVIVSPGISEPITLGMVSIPMPSLDSARENAVLLRSGALPFALTAAEEYIPGTPLMGDGVQNRLIIALSVFFVIVALYFLVCYRLGGFVAAWVLLLQLAFSWFFAALMGAGFTLLTLAAIFLAFLVTTFAVLNLYQGVKGDVQSGRSMRQALKAAYAGEGHTSLDVFAGLVLVSVVLIIIDQGVIRLFSEVFAVALLVGLALAHVLLRVLLNETIWLFGGRTSLYSAAPAQKKEA